MNDIIETSVLNDWLSKLLEWQWLGAFMERERRKRKDEPISKVHKKFWKFKFSPKCILAYRVSS
jgi:hypothetical protein